jgi:hypothetical protein
MRLDKKFSAKASLHSVHTNRNAVDKRERLRVFGENGSEAPPRNLRTINLLIDKANLAAV